VARLAAGIVIALVAAVCAVPATAQEAPADFTRLSTAQRTALAPLQPHWQELTPFQRQKWVEMAQRLPTLSADERERVRSRMLEWSRLSSQERRLARLQFQDVRQQLSPAELQQRWAAYRGLSDDERSVLVTRSTTARAATPAVAASAPARPGGLAVRTAPVRTAKQNSGAVQPMVATLQATPAMTVAPALVRASPGASTTPLSRSSHPALRARQDQPRVNATPGFVDATTLMPRRGVQGAAIVAPAQAAQLQMALQVLREVELAETAAAAAEAAAVAAAASAAEASAPAASAASAPTP
jgi:hypothetical protein